MWTMTTLFLVVCRFVSSRQCFPDSGCKLLCNNNFNHFSCHPHFLYYRRNKRQIGWRWERVWKREHLYAGTVWVCVGELAYNITLQHLWCGIVCWVASLCSCHLTQDAPVTTTHSGMQDSWSVHNSIFSHPPTPDHSASYMRISIGKLIESRTEVLGALDGNSDVRVSVFSIINLLIRAKMSKIFYSFSFRCLFRLMNWMVWPLWFLITVCVCVCFMSHIIKVWAHVFVMFIILTELWPNDHYLNIIFFIY